MKIRFFILNILLFTTVLGFSQQEVQFTQYMYNLSYINPAYTGSHGTLSATVFARSQWTGIDGAPQTISASINSPINETMGLGLTILADRIGPVKEEHVYADYSYTIKTSYKGRLAFGLKAGATFQNIDFLSLSHPEGDDPLVNRDNLNKVYPNFGGGLFYYDDKFYIGLSMPNFIESRHFEKTDGYVSGASENMHFYLTTGHVFDLNEEFKVRPSIMVRGTTGAPLSIDFTANMLWNEKFELGIGYRMNESISGIMNFVINGNLRLGYSYDHTLSNYGQYNSGSHEVFFLYDLRLIVRNQGSPRFF